MRTAIPLLLTALSLASLSAPVIAAEGETEEEFDFLVEGEEAAKKKAEEAAQSEDFDAFALEDEFDFSAPEPAPVVQVEREPQADNFPARVVETLPGRVVVELPVVLGTAAQVTQDFWLVGEVYVDGQKVGEVRQLVVASALGEHTSTAFLKVQAPVDQASGAVEVRVSQMVDGEQRALFSRSTDFRIGG
ncbi:MAG: hypothetical protein VX899_20590 [Myxococcota bacterium]|nr:hypothetical protein [Myxococcota bacterium]